MSNNKKLQLLRNNTILTDYQSSIDKLNDSTFMESKEDGEVLISRFNDEDNNVRSILGVVGENTSGKYIEKFDSYQWDGGYFSMEQYNWRKEQYRLINTPGSVYMYNTNTNKHFFVSPDNLSSYPSEDGNVPIGVLVIPLSHNVYGDNSCAVMSLKEMNYNSPDTGAISHQHMYWGDNTLDIPTLVNMRSVPGLGRMSTGTPANTIQGVTDDGAIPMDTGSYNTQNGVICPHDINAVYYNTTSSSWSFIPSPYLTDGSRNPLYYQTSSPSSVANMLSDFDGVGNTQIITNLATAQSDWKTASAITNSYSSGYYPAACCCWRFHTDGTSQGDWYLPACGELGYMISRFNAICTSIAALIDAYGNNVGVLLTLDSSAASYWSSTEGINYDSANVLNVWFGSRFGYAYKNGNGNVRAFLKVSGLD